MLTQNGVERIVKEERIRRTVIDLLRDPFGNNAFLTLEPPPLVSADLDKGKDIVFRYNETHTIGTSDNFDF